MSIFHILRWKMSEAKFSSYHNKWWVWSLLLFPLSAPSQVIFEARIDTLVMLIGEQRELMLDVTCDAQQKVKMPDLRPGQPLHEVIEAVGSPRPVRHMASAPSAFRRGRFSRAPQWRT